MTRYTHVVYAVTIGKKIHTANNMIHSVNNLEDASQTVKPPRGSANDDDIKNGNSDTPTVRMILTIESAELRNAAACYLPDNITNADVSPATPKPGANHAKGHFA